MKYWFDTEFIEDFGYIDLISIGIISEDNRTFYAISNEFVSVNASPWVQANVLPHLDPASTWQSREEIKKGIINFIADTKPEFWVYNGAYDWVLFAQIFGTIQDLPKGYPWYANDLKQLAHSINITSLPSHSSTKHHALEDAKWSKLAWEYLDSHK